MVSYRRFVIVMSRAVAARFAGTQPPNAFREIWKRAL
jgi:hypothetical protein